MAHPPNGRVTPREDRDAVVDEYLESFLRVEEGHRASADVRPAPIGGARAQSSFDWDRTWARTACCGGGRCLYCPECCRLLVPRSEWPRSIQDGTLRLPFEVDVVLTDRRAMATGLHAVAILRAAEDVRRVEIGGDSLYDGRTDQSADRIPEGGSSVALIGLDRADGVPRIDRGGTSAPEGEAFTDGGEGDVDDADGTYLLFPVPGESVPLSSVAHRVSRLVALDCTWTKASARRRPELARLPTVHLTDPPDRSRIWRWHNSGSGMLSTIEAVYHAAVEVSDVLEARRQPAVSREENARTSKDHIDLLWLFALQRAATLDAARRDGRDPPTSEAEKERRRAMRRTIGTEKHARDLEIGRLRKEQHKREKAAKRMEEERTRQLLKSSGCKEEVG